MEIGMFLFIGAIVFVAVLYYLDWRDAKEGRPLTIREWEQYWEQSIYDDKTSGRYNERRKAMWEKQKKEVYEEFGLKYETKD